MPNSLFLVANSENEFSEEIYSKSILETVPIISREPGSGTRLTMEQFDIDQQPKGAKKTRTNE